jgi:hypothetical protein
LFARPVRRSICLLAGVVALGGALIAAPIAAGAADPGAPAYTSVRAGAYGGEPSIASGPDGSLYITSPSDSIVHVSHDQGQTWVDRAGPDGSGDDCVTTDQSGAVYWCNLDGGADKLPLQTDVWKSTDDGVTWTQGQSQVSGNGGTCGNSCQPFGVDRQWTASWIPDGKTSTNDAVVAITYHDFYGPSSIWVNVSTDGGKTYGRSTNVVVNPAASPNAVAGSAAAEAYSFCSTVPAGIGIVPSGPHKGRIIVGWIAADPVADAGGCNLSQAEAFHTLWVSWSDDGGATWTPQEAFDAGPAHDASTPFVGFAIDRLGNPYFAFANNLSSNPATCSAESQQGTQQSDPSCEYDMYVVWSNDGGTTWDGGGGLFPGSAATPYKVSSGPSDTGTHWFPAIAVNNPGQVGVSYLQTPTIEPTNPSGKVNPGGCAKPVVCSWDLYAAQADLNGTTPATANWDITKVTTQPMHKGDICNLGIACVGSLGSNRNLLDFIQEAYDPTTGCAHIAYPDDVSHALYSANQTAGCFSNVQADLAEVPWAALALPVAALAILVTVRRRRPGGLAV